ncbi:hypothetical protein ACO3UB_01490 [Methanocaldococcus sp. 16A]
MTSDEEIIERLKTIRKIRKKRTLIGSFLVSMAIILSEASILIFVGMFEIDINIGLMLLLISLVFLSVGIYLIVHVPPIVIE